MKGKFDYGIPGKVVENSRRTSCATGATSPPIRSRATSSGSSPRTSAGASSSPTLDTKALIAKVNREDIWREAAKELGVPADQIPASTSRGKETFFDGKVFDPENPMRLPQEPGDQARRVVSVRRPMHRTGDSR